MKNEQVAELIEEFLESVATTAGYAYAIGDISLEVRDKLQGAVRSRVLEAYNYLGVEYKKENEEDE